MPNPTAVEPMTYSKSALAHRGSLDHRTGSGSLTDRIRAQLRKFGVGQQLCITKMGDGKGSIAMVPADTQTGDEIWAFSGTRGMYIMRKVNDGTYVVVGDVYAKIYYFLATVIGNSPPETIRIV